MFKKLKKIEYSDIHKIKLKIVTLIIKILNI